MLQIMGTILVLLSLSAATAIERQPVKRSYACPPNFIRLSHRCYFFSKEKATWQDAYFQCHSMHSNLAIIKNSNQDKLIRKTLTRKTLAPLERWLGGRFDWQQKQWKWAASGKPLSYKGFDKSVNQDEENLQWNCIIMDPELQFRWNARSCLEERHYICHKKIQTIDNNKTRKKLMQQYNTNHLNEIPIPDLSNDLTHKTSNNDLKIQQKIKPSTQQKSDPFHMEIYPLASHAQPAYRKKEKKLKKKNRKKLFPEPALKQFSNGTVYETYNRPAVVMNDQPFRRRRNKVKEDEKKQDELHMYYKTYKENGRRKHPLYPNTIVEEYNFAQKNTN